MIKKKAKHHRKINQMTVERMSLYSQLQKVNYFERRIGPINHPSFN